MESLDLLWMTITTVHDIVKAHKELADAVQELGDTVQLLSIAVKPLTEKTSNDSDEVQQVLKPFKQVLTDANKLLTQLMDEKKPSSSRFNMIFNLFRPQSYIEEIKNYHDKLKTMTPILTLAINSKMHRNGHTDVTHNFSATKFLKNHTFWVTHFGDTAFKIDWSRFCSAFEYQFVKDKKNFSASLLKTALDKNNGNIAVRVGGNCGVDGEVDIYEYDLLFREKDPWEVYLEIASVPAIEVTSESRKRKVEENSSDDVLIKKLKEVDKEVTSSPVVYRLVLFGKDDIITQEVFKGRYVSVGVTNMLDLLVVQQRWHEKPFEVGRAFFIDIPSNYVVRISRTHFQIECRTNNGVKEYFITDMSGNGTFLNGKLIGKEKSQKLEHGDKIGILVEKPSFAVEFGYIFKLEGKVEEKEEKDNNNNNASKNSAVV